jgi:hypothetical protein
MLEDLRTTLAAGGPAASYADYKRAIVDDNVLGKRTMATRDGSLRRLRELYALSAETLLFRALRDLWRADEDAQPLLALLCAVARDPLLRATADLILATPEGGFVTPAMLQAAVAAAFAGRYNPTSLASIGRHVASSWTQSGHLVGRTNKSRSRARSRPEAVAYALLLGARCGAGGNLLFGTLWARLLDAPEHLAREQAATAARRGWIDYRSAGGVTEVEFAYLLREEKDGR